jgi:hypothetical protein
MVLQRALWLAALLTSSRSTYVACPDGSVGGTYFQLQKDTGIAANSTLDESSTEFQLDCIVRCWQNRACISGFWKSDNTCVLFSSSFTPDSLKTELGTVFFTSGECLLFKHVQPNISSFHAFDISSNVPQRYVSEYHFKIYTIRTVIEEARNVALNKNATLSSQEPLGTDWYMPSSAAVDGNASSTYGSTGHCTHSGVGEVSPWSK